MKFKHISRNFLCEIFCSDIYVLIFSGVGAMEVVAMDMKLRGMYIARQLSFKGVTFQIEEIPFDGELEKTYNDSVNLVRVFIKFLIRTHFDSECYNRFDILAI